MTRLQGLLAAAAVLVAALLWQGWPEAPVAVPQPKALPVAVARLLPPQHDLSALAAHPLFSPSRMAPPVVGAASLPAALPTPTVQDVAPAPDPVQSPVLQGLILTPRPGAAYLGDPATGASYFLRPGDSALGLVLQSVDPGRAIFKGPQGEVILTFPPTESPAPEADPSRPGADLPGAGQADTLAPDAFVPMTEDQ